MKWNNLLRGHQQKTIEIGPLNQIDRQEREYHGETDQANETSNQEAINNKRRFQAQ